MAATPIQSWIKCNTDGASLGSTGLAPCEGIFRNCRGESLGCFAYNIRIANACLLIFLVSFWLLSVHIRRIRLISGLTLTQC